LRKPFQALGQTDSRTTVGSPGVYSVIVEGSAEQRLLLVKRQMMGYIIGAFIAGFVISVAGWIIPMIISARVELLRFRARKAADTAVN
jgi:hypothetical protein